MTRDDIIRQLYTVFHTPALYDIDTDKLHSILDAFAAAEREACAALVDANAAVCLNNSMLADVLAGSAMAIRARGEE